MNHSQARFFYASQTSVGRERKQNEDGIAVLCFDANTNNLPVSTGLFIVSDGMGGHNAGEIASMTAIKEFSSYITRALFQKRISQQLFQMPEGAYNYHFRRNRSAAKIPNETAVLAEALQSANTAIIDLSRKNPAFFGMGATFTAAWIEGRKVNLISIGDSRCYLIQSNTIQQLTRDHTIVTQMVELGKISPEDALHHPSRNFLYRSLGSEERAEADQLELRLDVPGHLLLCSDGLTNMLSDAVILDVVRKSKEPASAVRKLVSLANQAGGRDNISVILVKMTW